MNTPFVAVLMGSDSDYEVMEATVDILKSLEIPFELKVTSAHRTPADTHAYVKDADKRGCGVFIAAAGLAAHLAGTVAALTVKPVIGVPIDAGPLKGLDALLSTVQMPGGIPVASMGIGKHGAKNAAYFAAQIIGVSDEQTLQRIANVREDNAKQVRDKGKKLAEKVNTFS